MESRDSEGVPFAGWSVTRHLAPVQRAPAIHPLTDTTDLSSARCWTCVFQRQRTLPREFTSIRGAAHWLHRPLKGAEKWLRDHHEN